MVLRKTTQDLDILTSLWVTNRDGSKGGCGGVHTPPKYFKMPRHAGVGEEEGGGGGVNCVIVTIECIVILGILIFFFPYQL